MADNNEFPSKHMKKIVDIPDFIDSINSMDTDDIKKKVLETEGHIYEIDQSKQNDEALAKAREHSKELNAPYLESLGIERAKLQYLLFSLEQRGISL